ncbi:unnamed protein product [Heterotrigona itama]|uniref:Uncharacterized protein n=1 Tax=Heterotrigona itama TaxID=395501 RepID=A0A6V7HDP3_9HYME|nr:unnamed protein product [Heterotrigona itama]
MRTQMLRKLETRVSEGKLEKTRESARTKARRGTDASADFESEAESGIRGANRTCPTWEARPAILEARFSILEGAHMLAFVPLRPAKTSASPSPWSSNEPRAPTEQTETPRIGGEGGSKMRVTWLLFGLALLIAYAHSDPVVKREAESEDLNPLNEIYVVEADDDQADGDGTNKDKRNIGVLKLGVSNGIINFVFGKLDSFLDSKTKALSALDEANKVKNAAYGIDTKHSATTKFINELVASKVKAASGSIGPVLHSAQTFLSSAKQGLTGAVVSKFAPLSSIAQGLASASASKPDQDHDHDHGYGGGSSDEGKGGSNALSLLANLLTSKIGSLSSLSQQKNGGSSGSHEGGSDFGSIADETIQDVSYSPFGDTSPPQDTRVTFQCLERDRRRTITPLPPMSVHRLYELGLIATTTEDIPIFDRTKVSLDIPGPLFGSGFTVITNVTKVLNRAIMNSARRTQTVFNILKPVLNGIFPHSTVSKSKVDHK